MIPEPQRSFYQRLGHRLARARQAQRLTQREAAETLGCTSAKIHYIETATLRVNVHDLISLCILYGLNVNVELQAAWKAETEKV